MLCHVDGAVGTEEKLRCGFSESMLRCCMFRPVVLNHKRIARPLILGFDFDKPVVKILVTVVFLHKHRCLRRMCPRVRLREVNVRSQCCMTDALFFSQTSPVERVSPDHRHTCNIVFCGAQSDMECACVKRISVFALCFVINCMDVHMCTSFVCFSIHISI